MSDVGTPWFDADPDDAYADGGTIDPRSLAAWVHELRRSLVELANADGAGLDPLWHFFDLPQLDHDFAVALATAVIDAGAHNVLAFHDVLRTFDPTIAAWEDLTAAERNVATGVVVELADWLDAEGTTWD